MPYVLRHEGKISGVYEQPQYEEHEWDTPQDQWVPIATDFVVEDDAEVVAFRASLEQMAAPMDAASDAKAEAAKDDTAAAISKVSDVNIRAALQKMLELLT